MQLFQNVDFLRTAMEYLFNSIDTDQCAVALRGGRVTHGFISLIFEPSVKPGGQSRITFSPAFSPALTTLSSVPDAPTVTARRSARSFCTTRTTSRPSC